MNSYFLSMNSYIYILRCVISLYYPAHVTTYHIIFFIGTNPMSSKETQRKLINQNSSERKAQPPRFVPRKTVSLRDPSSDKKCPMKIIIFLGQDDRFYLSKSSCLHHLHHPRLNSEAVICGQRDMEEGDIDLILLLFSAHLSPLQITQIMSQLK